MCICAFLFEERREEKEKRKKKEKKKKGKEKRKEKKKKEEKGKEWGKEGSVFRVRSEISIGDDDENKVFSSLFVRFFWCFLVLRFFGF